MRPHASGKNHGLWAGPLITVLGFASYYTVFVWVDATRNLPWAPLGIMAGGLIWSGFATKRAWRRGGWRIGAAMLGTTFSSLTMALLLWYCFVFSYAMPAPGDPTAIGATIPALQAIDHAGTPVDLTGAAQGTLVLTFYRGHW
jgi:hypothetical protein